MSKKIRAYIKLRKNVPCMDCHCSYPPPKMTYDHVYGIKRFTLGRPRKKVTLEDVKKEISKCHVVCEDCHRKREKERQLPRHMIG